jgi:hypothetical protein
MGKHTKKGAGRKHSTTSISSQEGSTKILIYLTAENYQLLKLAQKQTRLTMTNAIDKLLTNAIRTQYTKEGKERQLVIDGLIMARLSDSPQ